ncbi:carboxypeptidase-like regulatory domain-containing protein [Candidatus Palauibacter polyketidifaciens]|uniref:carboxypeptidase-like regulatory domain-containing protein n=1 Tax=Candidatus Palauibacter polyketidifaciens TaxID=3056740 RepID=UPI0023955154|nr:carboxypeptidase-like regulatory domain-containing protein [Candidatus Palauibacter polyketidifaciens]MDE2721292.1 carboxypeptidase-like regulatory domain-containing protein [Candidatus Palauibacter polyketidifaciens]
MTAPASIGAAFVASFALGLLAPAVAAQEPVARLTGILMSEGDGAPVDGAVVSVDGPDGVVVWETLSNASGAFSLPLPPPGSYRVRVSRIGYESWISGPVRIDSAQASGPLRLEVPVRPVPLPELMVTEQTDCLTTPDERRRAFALYESVLPILDSMATAETHDSLLVRLERPIRIWNRGRFRRARDTVTVMVSEALPNASPRHLETYGYGDIVGDSMTTFYAPDGAALASPGFLATHCLSTAEVGTGAEVAALAFEPRPGREVVDVKGVLWIDTVANEPRELAFNYTSLRPFLRRYLVPPLRDYHESPTARRTRVGTIGVEESRFGGQLRFERVAGDRWLIREWRMLRPRLASRTFSAPRTGTTVLPLAVPVEYSGEVLALFRRTDRSPQ